MKVRTAVQRMGVYNPPLEMRVERDFLLLDFNESTLSPGPEVLAAMNAYIDQGRMRMYPAYGPFMEKLAAYAGVRTDQVIATNGADSAIQIITHALLEAGDEMIMALPGFHIIAASAQSMGATVVSPRYREPDMAFPLEEILEAVTPRTRLIVVINPNNPTGTLATTGQIETILRTHPEVAVMVDEVYYEFSGHTVAPLLAHHDNLVIVRSFSKAFALAALRLGYALSNPGFIAELNKIRIPYDVNALAVVAGEASLTHPASWRSYVEEVMGRAKPMVERFFEEHGVGYLKSHANFMLVQAEDPGEAYAVLKEHDILVRPQRPPLSGVFRLSIGTVADMRRFMEVYARYLESRASNRGNR